jgi:S1-C subfamily serine protease
MGGSTACDNWRCLMVVAYIAVVVLAITTPFRLTAEGEGYIGIPLDVNREGLVVKQVLEGSPGEKAGLKSGDEIAKPDGKPAGTRGDFIYAIRARKPGDEVALTVIRGKDTLEIKVKLGKLPTNPVYDRL